MHEIYDSFCIIGLSAYNDTAGREMFQFLVILLFAMIRGVKR